MSLASNALEALQSLVLPDEWQLEAIAGLRDRNDVIVDAPTGAGKTYIFEKFIDTANLNRQAIYTVPTRALANDKYMEWLAKGWRVGIATGDLAVDTEAPILVATLEAVQGVAFRKPLPALLVIDEYQWLGDEARGNHYEGVLLSLPREVRLLLLSGSVDNPEAVGHWLVRLGRKVLIVRHEERPVPLEVYDIDSLARTVPLAVEGFWTKRLAGALREGLGPILVFAPHRADAERLARQAARQLPQPDPLVLSNEQRRLAGSKLHRLLEQRIAYHHSGLTYSQRAGLIEPLAKAGQLRLVYSTLGLSAGINFSLRSVLITATQYMRQQVPVNIMPHELLQMMGRAGRRGLDQIGYYLYSQNSPRKLDARPMQLQRAKVLPWAILLRWLSQGESLANATDRFARGLFIKGNFDLGYDVNEIRREADFPCGNLNPTARARLVRRKRRPFKMCKACTLRKECSSLEPKATLIWQWVRTGLLTRNLQLTNRGKVAALFLGPEGLAVAAALEDEKYPIDDLVFELANLFGGERFCESESRWGGRLAIVCEKAYKRFSVEGYLQWGVPVHYGAGASEVIEKIFYGEKRKGQLKGEFAGVGDIDRLLTEWRSLLRQIIHAPELDLVRWRELQEKAKLCLSHEVSMINPTYQPLTEQQTRHVDHRLRWR
ncbi:MAG: DEAD/DEAH box helicase [Verrucomicrobiota bacterium]